MKVFKCLYFTQVPPISNFYNKGKILGSRFKSFINEDRQRRDMSTIKTN
jgi:hypothetical protein